MRARHRDQPARSLDHHALPVGDRRRDQRDPRVGIAARELAHPFGASARLAEPAPRLDQPDPPVARPPALAGIPEPEPPHPNLPHLPDPPENATPTRTATGSK